MDRRREPGHGYGLYASADEGEAFALLEEAAHGHMTVWHPAAHRPEITFLHHLPRSDLREIWAHVANQNPVLTLLEADPRATFTVFGPAAYVPSYWSDPVRGVPTSYYAWAQFEAEVTLVREPAEVKALLEAMLARLQPEGRHPPMELADRYWQGMLGAITGLRFHVREARARFKFGQNKPARTRRAIAEALRQRGAPDDAAAAAQVLARLPGADPLPDTGE